MATIELSNHLKSLMSTKSGSVDTQIVILDISSYSKRKSTNQKRVVERFQGDLKIALDEVGKLHLGYLQKNGLNLLHDVIVVPTGDGAILSFTFSGFPNFALDFARSMLKVCNDGNLSNTCEIFDKDNWCNCHSNYAIRAAINDGKAIIYEDYNGLINIAGASVNDALRIIGRAEPRQILVNELAYINLIDMSTDNSLDQKIVDVGMIKVKHGMELKVYQYVGWEEEYISKAPPMYMEIEKAMDSVMTSMGMTTKPFAPDPENKKNLLEMFTTISTAIQSMKKI